MTAEASNRRDRLREVLADLKMPGALEAVAVILAQAVAAARIVRVRLVHLPCVEVRALLGTLQLSSEPGVREAAVHVVHRL